MWTLITIPASEAAAVSAEPAALAITVSAEPAAAAFTRSHWARFVHSQRAAAVIGAIELLDCRRRFGV